MELQQIYIGKIQALENKAEAQTERMGSFEQTGQRYVEMLSEYEQISQRHDQQIAALAAELNERLHAMEERLAGQENLYNSRLNEAEGFLQELWEAGVPLSAGKDAGSYLCSSSQSGENAILAYITSYLGIDASACSYLDLGANHAKHLSNTYYFYKRGARGVLVEANPDLIAELKFYRSGDIILNRCIAEKSGQTVDFYLMSGDGLSTADKNWVGKVQESNPSIQVEKIVSVQTITVNEILDIYFDGAPVMINIDIEGCEKKILASINFETHRPLAILVEMIPYRPHLVVGRKDEEIVRFMKSKGYVEYAFTGINSIFLDEEQIKNRGALE